MQARFILSFLPSHHTQATHSSQRKECCGFGCRARPIAGQTSSHTNLVSNVEESDAVGIAARQLTSSLCFSHAEHWTKHTQPLSDERLLPPFTRPQTWVTVSRNSGQTSSHVDLYRAESKERGIREPLSDERLLPPLPRPQTWVTGCPAQFLSIQRPGDI